MVKSKKQLFSKNSRKNKKLIGGFKYKPGSIEFPCYSRGVIATIVNSIYLNENDEMKKFKTHILENYETASDLIDRGNNGTSIVTDEKVREHLITTFDEKITSFIKWDGSKFIIRNKSDLYNIEISKKKIIFCLHKKMIKKTSYILNFKKNFDFLSRSCFNLSCPGVVMPLCHHLIEGIKVGSIPITNCEELLYPNLNKEVSLQYSNLDHLIEKIDQALNMKEDEILFMRNKVLDFYKFNLSPEVFLEKFQKLVLQNKKKIICCDDHGSINAFKENIR